MAVRSALKQIVLSAYDWAATAVAAGWRGDTRSKGAGATAVIPDPDPVEPLEPVTPTATSSPGGAKRRPGIRGEVLEAVRAAGSEGATRAELFETLRVKGNAAGEKSVSNALSNLKKSGALLHEGNRYVAT